MASMVFESLGKPSKKYPKNSIANCLSLTPPSPPFSAKEKYVRISSLLHFECCSLVKSDFKDLLSLKIVDILQLCIRDMFG